MPSGAFFCNVFSGPGVPVTQNHATDTSTQATKIKDVQMLNQTRNKIFMPFFLFASTVGVACGGEDGDEAPDPATSAMDMAGMGSVSGGQVAGTGDGGGMGGAGAGQAGSETAGVPGEGGGTAGANDAGAIAGMGGEMAGMGGEIGDEMAGMGGEMVGMGGEMAGMAGDAGGTPVLDVPTTPDEMQAFLEAEGYIDWPSQPVTTNEGPTHGLKKTYNNTLLNASLAAGNEVHPVGAASVKELYRDPDTRKGWAVEVKVAEGDEADSWYWYYAPSGTLSTEGLGPNFCSNCHSGGSNFVFAPAF